MIMMIISCDYDDYDEDSMDVLHHRWFCIISIKKYEDNDGDEDDDNDANGDNHDQIALYIQHYFVAKKVRVAIKEH